MGSFPWGWVETEENVGRSELLGAEKACEGKPNSKMSGIPGGDEEDGGTPGETDGKCCLREHSRSYCEGCGGGGSREKNAAIKKLAEL